MKQVTRAEIFAQAAQKLRADFDELSVVPHAQLKGNQAEALVRAFLKQHLPRRFAVGSGFIIDGKDQISKQTDLIIYDALNCPVYRASNEAGIIPADNVAAVVEVKAKLDKERLREAAENCFAVKSLAKAPRPQQPVGFGPSLSQTFYAVFAFDTPLAVDTISEHYRDVTAEFGIGRHIDLIVILDRLILNLAARMPERHGWAPTFLEGIPPQAEGAHLSVGAMALGANTLDAFLRMLIPQLSFFREITGHPGFNWESMGARESKLFYLTSITHEQDPEARKRKLEAYADEVRKEFEAKPQKSD